jgi:hypothetical protein
MDPQTSVEPAPCFLSLGSNPAARHALMTASQ